jgi:hypothetical protein
MTDDQILAIELLNKFATDGNRPFVRPESYEGLHIARHGVKIKIPNPADTWKVYTLARNYLEAYMALAEENGGLAGAKVVYQEVAVFKTIDSNCNNLDGDDYCEIKMQRFIKLP